MKPLSRREALTGLSALLAVSTFPSAQAAELTLQQKRTRSRLRFPTYENPRFGRAEHEAYHRYLEEQYAFAEDPELTRWNSDPSHIFVNEHAGESIHITGVNRKQNYAEMIWVLAPAYTNDQGEQCRAHVPFEHRHVNQSEEFEKYEGDVVAQINGQRIQGDQTDFFVAQPHDDHIGWNPAIEPLAMRVRYHPGFDRDGERSMLVYWGFVNNASRIGEQGQPTDFALLGALSSHLGPQAVSTGMPEFLPRIARPFLVNPANQNRLARLYHELTGEEL